MRSRWTGLLLAPLVYYGCSRRLHTRAEARGPTPASVADVPVAPAPGEADVPASLAAAPGAWVSLSDAQVCVTEGALGRTSTGRLVIDAPKVRAVSLARTAQAAELRFTYLGATAVSAPLGSGEMRRQIGLKLRAHDACNLVYVMWRIAPVSQLVVSIKRNPGQTVSAECGTRGYRNIEPRRSAPVKAMVAGASHVLAASMGGDALRVTIDDAVVWEGEIGEEALTLDGPVGLRTDNGRFEVELLASGVQGGQTNAGECRQHAGDPPPPGETGDTGESGD